LLKAQSGNKGIRAALKALIETLKDPEASVRAEAVTCLGRLDSPLLTSVDTAPMTRQTVKDALAEMIVDGDAKVRLAAIESMRPGPEGPGVRIAPPQALAKGLKDESAQNRTAAINGLLFCSAGLDPWLPLLFQLVEHDPEDSVRSQCYFAIDQAFKPPAITGAVVPYLRGCLASKNLEIQCLAAAILATMQTDSRSAIPELLRIVKESPDLAGIRFRGSYRSGDPALAAALALGKIAPETAKAPEVIAALTEVLRTGPLTRQASAISALREFGEAAEPAIPALITLIKEAPPRRFYDRKNAAVEALGSLAPETAWAEEAVAALTQILQSEADPTLGAAIESLSRFGPKAKPALSSLRHLKDHGNAWVKDVATRAIQSIEETP
ncbi:HEAT repeat domain-containing protein, partial [Singulisphaera rosea]